MKIFLINANDNSIGGASRIAMDLHEGLLFNGHDSHIAVGKKTTDSNKIFEIPRNILRKITAVSLANDFEYFNSDIILELDSFKSADIVHCHNLNGWYFNLKTLLKISKLKPVVWTLHDMWPINPHSGYTTSLEMVNNLFTVSDSKLYPTMLWNNDKSLSFKKNEIYKNLKVNLVSPSYWLKSLTEKTSLGKNPITLIPNGIDTDIFSFKKNLDLLRAELGIGHKPVILFIGASGPTNKFKGFDDFLWLSNRQENAHMQFVCIGGNENLSVKNMRYIKATSDKKLLAKYLSVADVFILTSKYENFPLVILEALSCGTPVISYDVGGVPEILSGIDGCYLCPIGDRLGMAKNLNNFFLSRNNYNSLKRAEYLRQIAIDKFSLSLMIKNYINLYKSILSMGN